jgi:carbonic anhydrase/acetyltransferase-like protein (isoleucine patch superfamily)
MSVPTIGSFFDLERLTDIERELLGPLLPDHGKKGSAPLSFPRNWHAPESQEGDLFEAACQRFDELYRLHKERFQPITMARSDRKGRAGRHCDPVDLWKVNSKTRIYGGEDLQMESSFLRGPFYIGASSTVHSFSKLIGPAYFGNKLSTGSYVSLKRCFIRDEVEIDDDVQLEEALIGKGVRIGNGVRNYARPLKNEGSSMPIGVVLGDGVTVEPWAKFRPGAMVAPRTTVPEGALVGPGFHTQESLNRCPAYG